eukprot:1202740-Alexandrium_andersonii.AAC.1
MSASLVGSEMCIRDRSENMPYWCWASAGCKEGARVRGPRAKGRRLRYCCLLYTSDAADDM